MVTEAATADARESLLEAARQLEAAADPMTPPVDGMHARHYWRTQLVMRAEVFAREEKTRGSLRRSGERAAGEAAPR